MKLFIFPGIADHDLMAADVNVKPKLLNRSPSAVFCGSFSLFRFVLLFCLVCPFQIQPCDHLLGKGRLLGSLVSDVFLCFVTFPYGVPDQVWYLIVSIHDLC